MTDKYKALREAAVDALSMGQNQRVNLPGGALVELLTERDALLEALRKASCELSCMIDYVGESSAINMIGGREAHKEANKVLNEICAVFEPATRGAE